MLRQSIFALLLALAAVAAPLPAAEPAAPKPPAEYNVFLRYQIDAYRNEHVAQFREMVKKLTASGFQKVSEFEDEEENRYLNRMIGVAASDKTRGLLSERHVRTLLLLPREAKLPQDPDHPLRLQIDLLPGIDAGQNRLLAEQVRGVLIELGFREAVGYDSRSHTRLVGTIVLGRLDALLNDLRWLPASTTLLPKTLLSDLRRAPRGEDYLEEVLEEILKHPEGKKRFHLLFNDPKEQLHGEELLIKLAQLNQRGAAAEDVWVRLFHDLRQGPGSIDLLRIIMRYVDGSPIRGQLPLLYRSPAPIRVVEVMTDMAPTAARPLLPEIPAGTEKLTPDLRALLANKEEAAQPASLEIILAWTPEAQDRSWLRPLRQAAPGMSIDGRLGPLVSVRARPDQAPALAALPFVTTVRLAQSARPQMQVDGAPAGDLREAMKRAGLERLHQLGHRGKGVRSAVIDGDFRGWSTLVGKGLPARTTLVDLTSARSRDVLPDAFSGDPKTLGHGTRCALLLAAAAPEAELVLIRIDPSAPYQLLEAARFINGEETRSLSLGARVEELEEDARDLEERRKPLLDERRFLLNLLSDDDDDFKKKWDAYRKRQDQFDQNEREYQARLDRYTRLRRNLHGLKGIAIVANPLVWNEGHPVDGGSVLSRYFDDAPFQEALWFQAAGNTRGQAWNGLFRDADGDGVMEFVAPGAPLPAGRWSSELNFLDWVATPNEAKPTPDLPAKTSLRLSIQWREAHDPALADGGPDLFLDPLAELRLVVLRQRDPSGTKQPADDFEVVAQSSGRPQRLMNRPSFATYEQSVAFVTEAGGRYVVRVEGRAPVGTRPASAPTVPAAMQFSELRPRLFVQTLSGPGRAVFADFITDAPGQGAEGACIGAPADARLVVTVGAADAKNQPQPYSASGSPTNRELMRKPDVLAYDVPAGEDGAYGTSLSTSFAAGLAASALSAGAPTCRFLEVMQVQPGGILRIPYGWPVRGK